MKRTLKFLLVLSVILFPVTVQAENECRDKGFKQGIKQRAEVHRAQKKKENKIFKEKVKNMEVIKQVRLLLLLRLVRL